MKRIFGGTSRETIVNLGVVFLIPVVIYLANPNLFFGNNGTNPWMALGLYHHYVDAHTYFATAIRQIERIPAVLPGFVLYALFPPLVAHFLKFTFFYGLCVGSFYYVMRRECGDNAAILATALFATHSFFLDIVSSDYYGNGVVAYALAAMAAAVAARNAPRPSRRRGLLVLCGALMAASVFSHPYGVVVPMVAPLLYFDRVDFRDRTFLIQVVALAIWIPVGIAVATGVLSLISYFGLNGPLWFFKRSWSASKSLFLYKDVSLSFDNPGLAVVLSSALAAAALLATSSKRPILAGGNFDAHRLPVVALTWIVALGAAAAIGFDFLEIAKFNRWIVAPAFLAVGGLFARLADGARPPWVYGAVAAVVAVGAVNAGLADPPWGHRIGLGLPIVPVVFAALAAALLCRRWPAAARTGTVGAALVCAASLLATGQATIRGGGGYHKEPWTGMPRSLGFDRYVRIHEAMAFLHGMGWRTVPKFWIHSDKTASGGDLERTFLSYAFFIHPRAHKPPRSLIRFPAYQTGFLGDGETVVIVDGKPDAVGRANAALLPHGLRFEPTATHTVRRAGIEHFIAVGRIAAARP